jgi:hypothetical protein
MRRDELLVAAKPEQAHRVKPRRYRITPPVSRVVWRRKPQRYAASRRVIIADRVNPKMHCRISYYCQVCLILAGVPDLLILNK